MSKVELETVTQTLIELKKMQVICKQYREENKELKRRLKQFENLKKGMPDFLKEFGEKYRGYT